MWQLLAVRFIITADTQALPGFHLAVGPVPNQAGRAVYVYEQDSIPPYVRVVPAAAKVPEEQIVPTVVDPRFPIESVVLYSDSSHLSPAPIAGAFIPPVPVTASLADWSPGHMRIQLTGAAQRESYLLISETWYPDWNATIDGKAAPVHRADNALMSVVLPVGAREVLLSFHDPEYGTGRLITWISLLLAAALMLVPMFRRRSPAGV